MPVNHIQDRIRRSRLIMPVTQKRFVEKAHARNADAICLDLEDSVPSSEKIAARALVRDALAHAGKGGSEVIVRVNHTRELLMGDLEAAVWPGLDAVCLPKIESAQEVLAVESALAALEEKRGIPIGHVTINVIIESARGYLRAEEIAASSDRIDSLTLGSEDFATDTGISLCEDTYPGFLFPRLHLLIVARAWNKIPMGLAGNFTNFSDVEGYARSVALAAKYGFLGASCIHPDTVTALNHGFSPGPEATARAREVIAALDAGFAAGKAAVSLHGTMVDLPHYEAATRLLDRVRAIEVLELKKQAARNVVAKEGAA